MADGRRKAGTAWMAAVVAMLSCALVVRAQLPRRAEDLSGLDDEAFIEWLNEAGEDDSPDMRRLAKLFFSVAATLDGGRNGVGLLQSSISTRDLASSSVRAQVRAYYQQYAAAVERFKARVSVLLDGPDDVPLLFRAMMDGHEACWRLGRYTRLVETYGASAADLLTVVSSGEACGRFRRAAFQPAVEGIVADAVEQRARVARENQVLREELKALEDLLQELRKIEEEP